MGTLQLNVLKPARRRRIRLFRRRRATMIDLSRSSGRRRGPLFS
jgi:hypothetical protein